MLANRTRLTWGILILGVVAVIAPQALSDEKEAPPKPPTAEQMARFREAANPGPEHKEMAKRAGEWDTVIKYWSAPGAPTPAVMKGSMRSEMILGGRFLQSRSESRSQWGKAENMSILGFDRRNGEYTTVGYDTMGTYGVAARGKYDEKAKAIVLHGTDRDGILNHTQKYKFVTRIVSDDEYVTEVIFTDKMHTRGMVDEFKMVEITATRKKKPAK